MITMMGVTYVTIHSYKKIFSYDENFENLLLATSKYVIQYVNLVNMLLVPFTHFSHQPSPFSDYQSVPCI